MVGRAFTVIDSNLINYNGQLFIIFIGIYNNLGELFMPNHLKIEIFFLVGEINESSSFCILFKMLSVAIHAILFAYFSFSEEKKTWTLPWLLYDSNNNISMGKMCVLHIQFWMTMIFSSHHIIKTDTQTHRVVYVSVITKGHIC